MVELEEISTFCKKKGFIFQAGTIYGGLAGFFDFGPLGVLLKNNIKNEYLKKFVQKREDVVVQDGSIITNPNVWKASGHIDNFADLVLTTKKSKTKLRADHFIEDKLKIPTDGMSAQEIQKLIDENDLKYNGEEFEPISDFNLMFETNVGADSSKTSKSYLRPETCQSIFPNFKLILESSRVKLPFGICQIGKAFRNEISPRDFIFRTREFEQMELEYFYNPDEKCEMLTKEHLNTSFMFLSAEKQDEDNDFEKEVTIKELIDLGKLNKYHAFWLAEFYMWITEVIGIEKENLRIREHVKTELSHYSSATFDIDYKYPFGAKEMIGIANRGCFDLTQHQKHSKAKLTYFDENTKKHMTPSVIEPSAGVERLFLALLCDNYDEDLKRGNVVLGLDPKIAPYKVGIFPLIKNEALVKKARNIYEQLIEGDVYAFYDQSGTVGRRYARSDEIGVPYCVTVDFETVEEGKTKGTVTIRDRDSTKQVRVKISDVCDIVNKLINNKIEFKDLK